MAQGTHLQFSYQPSVAGTGAAQAVQEGDNLVSGGSLLGSKR